MQTYMYAQSDTVTRVGIVGGEGVGGWTPSSCLQMLIFRVEIGHKLQYLGKISNISAADAPTSVLLGQSNTDCYSNSGWSSRTYHWLQDHKSHHHYNWLVDRCSVVWDHPFFQLPLHTSVEYTAHLMLSNYAPNPEPHQWKWTVKTIIVWVYITAAQSVHRVMSHFLLSMFS